MKISSLKYYPIFYGKANVQPLHKQDGWHLCCLSLLEQGQVTFHFVFQGLRVTTTAFLVYAVILPHSGRVNLSFVFYAMVPPLYLRFILCV